MNFLDTYDITGSTQTPPPEPEQSLNEEVQQVMGQLNSFWGGFRKQSQAAFQTARKDFGSVVVQAQKELNKLTVADAPPVPSTSTSAPEDDPTHQDVKAASEPSDSTPPGNSNATVQSLFSRLQSAIPPNVVSTVQNNLPESIRHASENLDIAQLRTTLGSEFQRVQGVTRSQAEEYMHKSEALLRDVVKEAGEVLRDAVKVIPPEEASASSSSGLLWDGTDMWMLPDNATTDSTTHSSNKGKDKESAQLAVATRAEALLRRLKHDPDILKHDPNSDKNIGELFAHWLQTEFKDAQMTDEPWAGRIQALLDGSVDGTALQTTHDTIVPAHITEAVFWQRYFFRVHQIEREEEKRKALFQESTDDDDFHWEDEDEEESPPTKPELKSKASTTTLQQPSVSPRESSEDSFDLVSSGNVSETKKKSNESDDGGDSDWE